MGCLANLLRCPFFHSFKHRTMSMPMPLTNGNDQVERELFHVLAIDDSVIDRKLIERLLQISSYKVTTVDSGIKALKLLGLQHEGSIISSSLTSPPAANLDLNNHQDKNVNLIITDYFMPEMTGYDLLRRIKDSEFYKDTPVVVMSSENIPSAITRCLESGAQEFILKPVRLSDVTKLRPHLLIKQHTTTPHHTTTHL